jgi:hypothetical protein
MDGHHASARSLLAAVIFTEPTPINAHHRFGSGKGDARLFPHQGNWISYLLSTPSSLSFPRELARELLL